MTAPVRETPSPAAHASPTAWPIRRIILRAGVISVAVGALLGFGGAFGTGDLPVLQRCGLMILFTLIGATLGVSAFYLVAKIPAVRARPILNGVLGGALMFAPMGLLAWGLNGLIFGYLPSAETIPGFIFTSLVISAFMTMISIAINRREPAMEVTQATTAPARFLERLPLKLRGADVWAVEAEDHYLRLHTSKGQDLVLMRLSDAVDELAGIEGAQVHRSWWVARGAIASAKRSDGRAVLTLKDGSQVPVSRTYAGELRSRGWI